MDGTIGSARYDKHWCPLFKGFSPFPSRRVVTVHVALAEDGVNGVSPVTTEIVGMLAKTPFPDVTAISISN